MGPRLAQRPSSLAVLLWALLPLTLAPETTAGQEPLVTDRPDVTESALTVPPGVVQVELGYTIARVDDATQHGIGEALVRIGARRGLEARIGINSYVVVDEDGVDRDGFQDPTLGAKAILHRRAEDGPAWAPDVALLAAVSLPVGAEDVGEEGVRPGAILALAWPLAERLALGANLGWSYASDGGDRFHDFLASASLGIAATDRLGLFVEYFGSFPTEDRDSANGVDTGVTLLLSSRVQVDARVGLGLDGPDPNWFAGAGIGFRP